VENIDHEKSSVARIFDIQRYSINDGPGIRTTVFFKGCPLRCAWCANPESIRKEPQLLFSASLCTKCYKCVSLCSTGATTIDGSNGNILIDRNLCTACGRCVTVCASEARKISGRLMHLKDVIEVIKKDALFYRVSGGGVTASGGEPTAQPEFLLALFKWCQERNIFTTLDTCGYVRWEILRPILDYTELVLFDIKHIDPARHKEHTGVDNRLILENALKIVRQGTPIRIRMPLIPRVNDSDGNIRFTAGLVKQLGLDKIDLLPYHQLGKNKYERLGNVYSLNHIEAYAKEQLEEVANKFESLGIEAIMA